MKLASRAATAALSSWESRNNEPPEDDDSIMCRVYGTIRQSGKEIDKWSETIDFDKDSIDVASIAYSNWLSTPNGQKWNWTPDRPPLPVKEATYTSELSNGWQFERATCGGVTVTIRISPPENY
jgi:hypothetical protein